jgi:hypothetical protein
MPLSPAERVWVNPEPALVTKWTLEESRKSDGVDLYAEVVQQPYP